MDGLVGLQALIDIVTMIAGGLRRLTRRLRGLPPIVEPPKPPERTIVSGRTVVVVTALAVLILFVAPLVLLGLVNN